MTSHIETNRQAAQDAFVASAVALGAKEENATHYFEIAWQSGCLPTRHYHSTKHYLDVASDEWYQVDSSDPYSAMRFITGFHHDIVYQHVDQKTLNNGGFSEGVREEIEKLVTLEIPDKDNVFVRFDPEKLQDPTRKALVSAASYLCGITNSIELPSERVKLNKFAGQNEFLSALYAISAGMEMGIKPQHILSEMAMIAGTIPFHSPQRFCKTNGNHDDEKLEFRLRAICEAFPAINIDEAAIDSTLESSLMVSNADIKNFGYPFKSDSVESFSENSLLLILENIPEFAEKGQLDNVSPDSLLRALKNMIGYMRSVSSSEKQSIFHTRDGSPHPLEDTANANITQLSQFIDAVCKSLETRKEDYYGKYQNDASSIAEIYSEVEGMEAAKFFEALEGTNQQRTPVEVDACGVRVYSVTVEPTTPAMRAARG